MTLPCEFCGAPVKDWDMPSIPPCCKDCSWIPALLGIVGLILFGGIVYVVVRSLYG